MPTCPYCGAELDMDRRHCAGRADCPWVSCPNPECGSPHRNRAVHPNPPARRT